MPRIFCWGNRCRVSPSRRCFVLSLTMSRPQFWWLTSGLWALLRAKAVWVLSPSVRPGGPLGPRGSSGTAHAGEAPIYLADSHKLTVFRKKNNTNLSMSVTSFGQLQLFKRQRVPSECGSQQCPRNDWRGGVLPKRQLLLESCSALYISCSRGLLWV